MHELEKILGLNTDGIEVVEGNDDENVELVSNELCPTIKSLLEPVNGEIPDTQMNRRIVDSAKWRARALINQPYFGHEETELDIAAGTTDAMNTAIFWSRKDWENSMEEQFRG